MDCLSLWIVGLVLGLTLQKAKAKFRNLQRVSDELSQFSSLFLSRCKETKREEEEEMISGCPHEKSEMREMRDRERGERVRERER